MKRSRRSFVSIAAVVASAVAASANAQFGSRQRGGDSGSPRSSRPGNGNSRAAMQTLLDPLAAIERELPSLRIDLKLTADQAPLFDSFEREARNAAEAERLRARHVSAFRLDDGGSVAAQIVLGTIADDDSARADAARMTLERMTALYAALTPDQKKQFDRRIIQSIREPLGSS